MRIVNEEFLLFWGSEDYLSNWHPVEFSVSDVVYQCVEQYMMAAKARMFGDLATEMKILQTPNPRSAKALGREVQGFDDAVWIRRRQKVVFDASGRSQSLRPHLGHRHECRRRACRTAFFLAGIKPSGICPHAGSHGIAD